MRKLTRHELLLIGAVAVAAFLRIAAARGELWFDEVWSIRLVEEFVRSPADLVFRLQHDNNHILNSLVAYLVGPDGASWQYRWPAVLFGIATVALAGWVQRRRGFATMFAAVVLCGGSYLLVQYGSEARGYAYLLFFTLLAYAALWEAEETGDRRWELVFAASCLLGFLAHPLFATTYLAVQLWTWIPWPTSPLRDVVSRAILRTIVPGLWAGWLYWVNYGRMTVGGGMEEPWSNVFLETFSISVGGPFRGPIAYVAAMAAIVATVAAFWSIVGERRRAAFYFYLIIVAPVVVFAASGRSDLYPRYFLGSVLFACLLWSELLGKVRGHGADGVIWYRVLLVAFVLANGAHVGRLIIYQRAHYAAVLDTIQLRSQGDRIRMLVDHPLRHQLMLDFLARSRPDDKPIDAELPTEENVGVADWLLRHEASPSDSPPPAIEFPSGEAFRLVERYPTAGLPGWELALYQRVPKQ